MHAIFHSSILQKIAYEFPGNFYSSSTSNHFNGKKEIRTQFWMNSKQTPCELLTHCNLKEILWGFYYKVIAYDDSYQWEIVLAKKIVIFLRLFVENTNRYSYSILTKLIESQTTLFQSSHYLRCSQSTVRPVFNSLFFQSKWSQEVYWLCECF